jgi:hypothetical protein
MNKKSNKNMSMSLWKIKRKLNYESMEIIPKEKHCLISRLVKLVGQSFHTKNVINYKFCFLI